MANTKRGEVQMTLCGKEYVLKPSFQANCEFEERSGCTVFEALENIQKRCCPALIQASALWAGLRGACDTAKERSNSLSFQECGELMFNNGIDQPLLIGLLEYFAAAVAGDSPGDLEKPEGSEDQEEAISKK